MPASTAANGGQQTNQNFTRTRSLFVGRAWLASSHGRAALGVSVLLHRLGPLHLLKRVAHAVQFADVAGGLHKVAKGAEHLLFGWIGVDEQRKRAARIGPTPTVHKNWGTMIMIYTTKTENDGTIQRGAYSRRELSTGDAWHSAAGVVFLRGVIST